MQNLIGKSILALVLFMPSFAFADCSAFEAEAQVFDGVVPKFNEDGSLRAMLMYGEGTFMVPKRSLINDARRQAQMRATRNFSEFLESNFNAEEVRQKMINQIEATDHNGNTAGLAEEISSSLESMQSNTSATLSGLVKLDECVDTEGKYVMVAMGWKPEYSEAASQAAAQAAGESAGQEGDGTVPVGQITKAKGHRKKSKLADDF